MSDSSDFIRRTRQRQDQPPVTSPVAKTIHEAPIIYPTESGKGFSVLYQQKELLKAMFGGLLLATIAAFWTWTSWKHEIKTIKDLALLIFLPPIAILMSVVSLQIFRILLKGSLALEVNQDGITYHSTLKGAQWIPWSDVASFELRDHAGRKNQIETTLHILPHKTSKSSSMHISVGNLATNSDSLIESLKAYSLAIDSDRVGKQVNDKRNPHSAQIIGGVAAVIVWAIVVLCRGISHTTGPDPNDRLESLDSALSQEAIFVAIKQVDPDSYQRFRNDLKEIVVKGQPDEKIKEKVSNFTSDFVDERLKHASADTLMQYLRVRLNYFDEVNTISPEALYAIVVRNDNNMNDMPVGARGQLEVVVERLNDNVAKIITAAPSDTPIAPNSTVAKQRLTEVCSRLSPEEQAVIKSSDQSEVDKTLFCQALLHIYRETMTLPSTDAVLVFRTLTLLPKDDRVEQ